MPLAIDLDLEDAQIIWSANYTNGVISMVRTTTTISKIDAIILTFQIYRP